jgi:membrane-anchored glycerophosphoryl diester phosphodiesterase (GDPDase)
MANINPLTVEERIKNGYQFDFGKYLNEGFQIFGKEWILFSLYGLVAFLILAFSMVTIIGFFFLLFPTLLGFSIAADKVVKGEKLIFNDFFGGFKNFGSHSVIGSIYGFLYACMFGPYFFMIYYTVENNSEEAFLGMGLSLGFMFLMVAVMYMVSVFLFFAPYLIHYGGYSMGEAIKKSIALSKKNFWWMLLLIFIVGFISGIGQYACIIGMFPTIAISMLINYSLVKNVLLTGEYSEIDEIGTI